MSRMRTLVITGVLGVASALTAVVMAPSAHADTQICDQYGSTTIGGKYVVQNNRWGTSATQCINVTSTGFSIVQQAGTGNTSGAPVSYPSVFLGCHYSNCSPGSPLPAQISKISAANTSISNSYPGSGTYDASYDIWLNADTNVSGVQDTEIMVWLHHTGSIQPIGSQTATVSIAGRSWAVWTGNNGSNNVVSYVQSGISSLSFDVMDFVRDTLNRGSQYGNSSWYLTSIQAGFEPWVGGVGLAVNNFSASITTGGGGGTSPSPQPSTSPTGGGGTGSGCAATFKVTNSWQGGFNADVTVKNNGSATLNGWTVKGTLPSGVSIANLWSGVLTTSGQSITVKNVNYNGTLGGGASTSFGFTANGTAPGSLALTCTSP
ncbi:GH12 family glycosyl hydrolase domain-containing protein [Hamadaea tsunoensis]|uniref:GH12 family glycosyl hydrolase domain-containing protein n=1 Tax=Hamadaea tsunoensis TaxID=53368 RepID=UPI000487E82D|nr:cellulose binding domain-containing protein [Hamadaea tsunoensis]